MLPIAWLLKPLMNLIVWIMNGWSFAEMLMELQDLGRKGAVLDLIPSHDLG